MMTNQSSLVALLGWIVLCLSIYLTLILGGLNHIWCWSEAKLMLIWNLKKLLVVKVIEGVVNIIIILMICHHWWLLLHLLLTRWNGEAWFIYWYYSCKEIFYIWVTAALLMILIYFWVSILLRRSLHFFSRFILLCFLHLVDLFLSPLGFLLVISLLILHFRFTLQFGSLPHIFNICNFRRPSWTSLVRFSLIIFLNFTDQEILFVVTSALLWYLLTWLADWSVARWSFLCVKRTDAFSFATVLQIFWLLFKPIIR